jgi:hypothetical protein
MAWRRVLPATRADEKSDQRVACQHSIRRSLRHSPRSIAETARTGLRQLRLGINFLVASL